MISIFERYKYLLLGCVLGAGVAFSSFVGLSAYNINKQLGFPLDDPWIHLQFAKNLHDYGSFSYFKNEMVTAGSTSPLYTILLAIGFLVTSNEMMLSYVLGVLFLLVAGAFLFKIVFQGSGSSVVALGATALLLSEMRMQWAALSGMETTLFICMLLGVFYFYQTKQSVPLGIASGLLIWTRPEAIIFFIALALDVIYHVLWVAAPKKKKKTEASSMPSLAWLKPSLIALAVFALAYAGFNMYLSVSIFPNTFAAKLKYYGGGTKAGFPSEVFHFLADGHMVLIILLAALGIFQILQKALRRQSQLQLVPLFFAVGLFLVYWMRLPFLYQEGRYMMPLLPFVILLAMAGLEFVVAAVRVLRKKQAGVIVQIALLVIMVAQCGYASWEKRTDYATMCRYISDRQVRTANWLHDNTPENAVVATHDIGAIAFYSGRRIADMVGLVSPEMIENIGNLDKLREFLIQNRVTHIAVLRNWFEIVNMTPLFVTDEHDPEIMEVFAFNPERTHITSPDASRAVGVAAQYLYQGQFQYAGEVLQRALTFDSQNSKVHHLLGSLFLATGRLDDATREFSLALRLHPEFLESQIGLAQVAARQNKPGEAVARLEAMASRNPNYPTVYRALADVYTTFKLDSAKTALYMRRFNELARGQSARMGEQ